MEILLLVGYLLVLAVLIAALVRVSRRPTGVKWTLLFLSEAGAIILAGGLMRLFDGLAGPGPMGALTWFAEALFSMGAAFVYWLLLMVTAVVYFVKAMGNKRPLGK